jgi:hypothetical protein
MCERIINKSCLNTRQNRREISNWIGQPTHHQTHQPSYCLLCLSQFRPVRPAINSNPLCSLPNILCSQPTQKKHRTSQDDGRGRIFPSVVPHFEMVGAVDYDTPMRERIFLLLHQSAPQCVVVVGHMGSGGGVFWREKTENKKLKNEYRLWLELRWVTKFGSSSPLLSS